MPKTTVSKIRDIRCLATDDVALEEKTTRTKSVAVDNARSIEIPEAVVVAMDTRAKKKRKGGDRK